MSRHAVAAGAAALLLAGPLPLLRAQDLSPRAYLITPVRANAVTVGNVFNDGDLHFEGTVPITGATGRMNMPNVTLYRSLSVFGRSANATATLAYGVGHFKGTAFGAETEIYRSGLFDSVFRFSVNLKGAPAMGVGDFRKWQQKTAAALGLPRRQGHGGRDAPGGHARGLPRHQRDGTRAEGRDALQGPRAVRGREPARAAVRRLPDRG